MEGYREAREDAVWVDRSHRARLRLTGRAPARMLTGLVSGTIPGPLEGEEGELLRGRVFPSAVLTPKGRIVTELRIHRMENGEEGAFFLDLPAAGLEGLQEHLRKYLPPRFARTEEISRETGHLSLLGPRGAAILAELVGDPLPAGELEALEEGEERVVPLADGSPQGALRGELRIVRTGEVDVPAFDVFVPGEAFRTLREGFTEAGARGSDPALWQLLRVEKGRPVFGRELDEGVIPPEAGLETRFVDQLKGCYTGQEVIVRIRDRGRVNRHLRGLLLGEGETPEPGTPVFASGRDRPAGELRTVVASPRFGETVALGYVRREVEPPDTVHVGGPDGPVARVRALSEDGWVLFPGDPGA